MLSFFDTFSFLFLVFHCIYLFYRWFKPVAILEPHRESWLTKVDMQEMDLIICSYWTTLALWQLIVWTSTEIGTFRFSLLNYKLQMKRLEIVATESVEKEMATHSWRIPWTEESGRLYPWGCRGQTLLSN